MKKYFQHISYALVFLFLFNMGAVASVSFASVGVNSLDGNVERILICTSRGYQWVSITDLGVDTPASETHTASLHDCPLCSSQSIDIDSVSLGLLVDFSSLQFRQGFTNNYINDSLNSFLYWRNTPPRAPPAA